MKLPKFSIIQSDPMDLPGAGYILHSEEAPFHLGRIVKYGNATEMAVCMASRPKFIQAQITNYSIVISLAGSVEGRILVPADGTYKLQKLINEMAAWYNEHYISKNPQKFKKYIL